MLKSRNVYPEKLSKTGFEFSYPGIDETMDHLLKT
ncbi:DUF1731 domain-containing protein [Chryseobacterium sp.]|nr:DUF1731 domain-containing protein [Chryseobacterium sp.]